MLNFLTEVCFMTKYLSVIKKCPLFAGIEDADIGKILPCLSATVHRAEKNTFIFSAEDRVRTVGLVLSGSVHFVNEDFWGRKDILSQLGPGELFAESFSCAREEKLPVGVLAAEPTDYMLIDCGKVIRTCTSACMFHTQLIANMMQILRKKYRTEQQDRSALRPHDARKAAFLPFRRIAESRRQPI
jgi:CRP-like cAMP-binding protein